MILYDLHEAPCIGLVSFYETHNKMQNLTLHQTHLPMEVCLIDMLCLKPFQTKNQTSSDQESHLTPDTENNESPKVSKK